MTIDVINVDDSGASIDIGLSYVYFLASTDGKSFKIGKSNNPLSRLKQLPEKIDLNRSTVFSVAAKDVFRHEKILHALFGEYKVDKDFGDGYTEWFAIEKMSRAIQYVKENADLISWTNHETLLSHVNRRCGHNLTITDNQFALDGGLLTRVKSNGGKLTVLQPEEIRGELVRELCKTYIQHVRFAPNASYISEIAEDVQECHKIIRRIGSGKDTTKWLQDLGCESGIINTFLDKYSSGIPPLPHGDCSNVLWAYDLANRLKGSINDSEGVPIADGKFYEIPYWRNTKKLEADLQYILRLIKSFQEENLPIDSRLIDWVWKSEDLIGQLNIVGFNRFTKIDVRNFSTADCAWMEVPGFEGALADLHCDQCSEAIDLISTQSAKRFFLREGLIDKHSRFFWWLANFDECKDLENFLRNNSIPKNSPKYRGECTIIEIETYINARSRVPLSQLFCSNDDDLDDYQAQRARE